MDTSGWFWWGNSSLNENIKLHYKFLNNTPSTLFFNFKTLYEWQDERADTVINFACFFLPK
jgi:hypothetical protein